MRRAKPKGGDTRVSPPSPSVEVVPTNAVPLLEILPTSKLWSAPESLPRTLAAMRGAIVKAQPPEGATDVQVQSFRRVCEARGAAHVRVLPRQRSREVVAKEAAPAPAAHRDLRGAVEAALAASTYPDKGELRAALESVLAAVGL